jgi:glycosyltransferase involved in cell wall biosynthesis
VGGGPQQVELQALAARLGVSDKVMFVGRVPHQEVSRYYNLIDILVYPRLSMRLTELVTPLKPLEAMAQGKLFIASDVGGHHELIRNLETGVLFKAGDVRDLASKVLYLLSDTTRGLDIVAAGRQYVENERTWKAVVSRYAEIYKMLGNAI